MNEKQLEIYNAVNNMDKMDAYSYSNLLSVYGETLVNEVMDIILSENDKNASKLEYYVSKVIAYEDVTVTDLYDAYVNDLGVIPCLTREENIKLTSELHSIVVKINKLLDLIGYEGTSLWISDKVDECLESCEDFTLLTELKKLYNMFVEKRNFLVEGNLRLVISFSKKFYKNGCDFNEIVQLGNLGLMRALEKYDPKHNACISTYSYHWIKQSITRNMTYVMSSISIPYHLVSMNMTMNKAIKELRMSLGKEPSVNEIADYMGITSEKVNEIKAMFLDVMSLDEPVIAPGDSESDFSIIDTIIDESTDVESQVILDDMSMEVMCAVRECLTEQEYNIICHRFSLGNYNFLTLGGLGEKMGVTRERIRQIEAKAKLKLRKKNRNLKSYLD